MIRRKVIVDAYDECGQQGKADIFDLDEESLQLVLKQLEQGLERDTDAERLVLRLQPGLQFR
jgi:hypothetical protein